MKPENDPSKADGIFDLFEKAIEGELSKSEGQRLDALVANDADVRKSYLDFTHLHACLRWKSLAVGPADRRELASSNCQQSGSSRRTSKLRSSGWIVALAAAIALVAVGYRAGNWASDAPSSPMIAATLTDTKDCVWGPGLLPTEKGAELTQGNLNLVSGIASLRFASGAEVILEAPAELEIVDAMHCVLKNGTLLANVPEEAHGFMVDTESAQLIDQGTAFGVSVNREKSTTDVNVFEGIVDVEQHSSHEQQRLTEGQRSVVDDDSFEVFSAESHDIDEDLEDPLAAEHDDDSVIAITTGDGDGKDSFVRSFKPDEGRYISLLLVKNSAYEFSYHLKTYLAFDFKLLPARKIKNARLQLQIQRHEGRGYASFVPDATFGVYGVTEEGVSDWLGKTLSWNSAPANRPGGAELDPTKIRLLGRFVVPQGKYDGFVSMESSELSEFITEKHDQVATIVIVRETVETQPGGLIHAFAGRKTPESSPPTLLIEVQ